MEGTGKSSKTEAVSEDMSKDWSKGFFTSKKAKVLTPMNDRFRAALDYNTYGLVERSLLYGRQDVKQVAK